MVDIENKVYCSSLPFSYHSPLFPDHALIFSRAFHFRVIPAISPAVIDQKYSELFTFMIKA